MDEAVVGLGFCCSVVPAILAGIVALTARQRATDALKQASKLSLEVNALRTQLARATLMATRPLAPEEVVTAPVPAVSRAMASTSPPEPEEVSPTPPPARHEATDAFVAPREEAARDRSAPFQPEPAAAPPVEPPPASPPRAPPPPPAAPIDWEKWFGVRGAAVLGGIVFALAGVYLFRYSVARGWLTPPLRVIGGELAGLGALVFGQRLRERYRTTAHALSGGGIVVLYAATWAARALYELLPFGPAFLLMVLITAAACALAIKQDNALAAYLGLVGGFLTPLLLSRGENAPLPLFGYVLLLDLGLLAVARLRQWAGVATLALVGTVLLQLGWVFDRMEPHQVGIAFVVIGVFATLFVAALPSLMRGKTPSTVLKLVQASALFVPAVTLVYFAASSRLEVPFWPTAGFLTVLWLGVNVVNVRSAKGEPWLLFAAVGSVLLVFATWAGAKGGVESAWPLVGVLLGLSAVSLVLTRLEASAEATLALQRATRWFQGGAMLVLLVDGLAMGPLQSHVSLYVGAAALTLLTVLSFLRSPVSGWEVPVGLAPAAFWFVDLLALQFQVSGPLTSMDVTELFGPMLALGVGLLGLGLWRRTERLTLVFGLATMSASLLSTQAAPAQPLHLTIALALLGVLTVVAALRAESAGGTIAAVALLAVRFVPPMAVDEGSLAPSLELLVAMAVTALVLHLAVVTGPKALHRGSVGPLAMALVLPLFFPALWLRWREAFGPQAQGLLPVLLAGVSVGTAARFRRRGGAQAGAMWQLAAAAMFLAVAVPLQLERQWITVSWALMAVAHLALWRRFDSRALKWFALSLLAAVVVRLLCNPAVLDYATARSALPVFNWLMYTYLLPAGCLAVAAWLLRADELARARGWETSLYGLQVAWGAASASISACLVVFAWVTLTVLDAFSPTGALSFDLERLPARDLTLSLGWLLYAASLLALGMWRRSKPMRWLSLGFVLLSIGKVFLYDLGELKDLYRVASLAGLALSLIGISLAYQRFVFARAAGAADVGASGD